MNEDIRKQIRSGQIKAKSISIAGNSIRSDGRKYTKPNMDTVTAARRKANKRARRARKKS